jgi:hypothetical protein
MWLALKLLASGAFEGLMKGLSAAFKWLCADWRNLAFAIFLPLLLWTGWITIPGLRADLADTKASLVAEQAAHLGTVNAFLAASKQAQAEAEANVARVTAEQEHITDATLASYRADLGALRARFDRLRQQSRAPVHPGHADPAGLPGLPGAAGGIAGAPAQDRLPAAPALSLDDALIASEQALQLQALIDWVAAQSAVRFTPEGDK